ncbi:hypothetical protein [Elizabethkingia anophelis]|nr:hypothetical protein [Elizabethkingia anophelis]MCT4042827.1 hypothetical protein [Elizabethkingia anophelis]MDE5526630.1 hypothetical protein [Elizabethkingia meningoseptica]
MTWREYQLRKKGYEREKKLESYITRDIVYHSLVSTGAIDPKKIPINSFRPLDGNTVEKVSDKAKASYEKAMKEYLNEVGVKNGGS